MKCNFLIKDSENEIVGSTTDLVLKNKKPRFQVPGVDISHELSFTACIDGHYSVDMIIDGQKSATYLFSIINHDINS